MIQVLDTWIRGAIAFIMRNVLLPTKKLRSKLLINNFELFPRHIFVCSRLIKKCMYCAQDSMHTFYRLYEKPLLIGMCEKS